MRVQHWQDISSLVLGAWLVVSPLVLGFADVAAWITVVLGVCVMVFAVEGMVLPSFLEEWGEIGLGLALLVAPWTVGYDSQMATYSSMATGVLVMAFALWEMLTDSEFTTWRQEHSHHPAA